MVHRVITLAVFIAVPAMLYAQAPAEATANPATPIAAPGAAPGEAAPPPSEPEPVGPPGDLVTLKNGHVYRGLQVIRSTAAEVTLEVLDGVTIRVPRRQVMSIEYDDIDPIADRQKQKSAAAAAEAETARLLAGQKVSPAIQLQLGVDISNPPFLFDKADISAVIAEVNKRVNEVIEVDKPVQDMPEEERKWTLGSTPGMKLSTLLGDVLAKDFPNLTMVVRNDKLLITTKDAAKEILGAAITAPADPAAPPAGAPPPAAPVPPAPASP